MYGMVTGQTHTNFPPEHLIITIAILNNGIQNVCCVGNEVYSKKSHDLENASTQLWHVIRVKIKKENTLRCEFKIICSLSFNSANLRYFPA